MDNPTAEQLKRAIESQKEIWAELIAERAVGICSTLGRIAHRDFDFFEFYVRGGVSYMGIEGSWTFSAAQAVRKSDSFCSFIKVWATDPPTNPVVTEEHYNLIREFWELHDLMEDL
jgi:hypothetical protein